MKKHLLSIITSAVLLGSFQQVKAQANAALNFNGSNTYVAVNEQGNILDNLGTGNFTTEAWINSSDNSSVSSIFRKSGDYNLYLNGGILNAEVWPNGMSDATWINVIGSTVLPTNTWVHVAFTWNNTSNTGILYVNGVAENSSVNTNNVSSSESLWIGMSATYAQGFTGNIDEVHIWNYDRTQAQIQNNMNCSLSGAQTGLLLSYTFNGGAAIPNSNNIGITLVMDKSGNSNTGTLTNFALTGTTSNWVNDVTTINPVSYATVVASTTTIGSGSTVSFTATPVNGGSAPAYQWIKNHMNVGTNSNVYTDNTLLNKDTVTCMITSSGNCIAKDSISNKTGITVTQLAASLNFDGTDDYVSVPNGLPAMSDVTIETWVYPKTLGNDFDALLNFSGWSTGWMHFQFYPSGQLEFSINGNNPSNQITSMTFSTNQWYHVAVVYSSANLYTKFYVNGLLTDSFPYTTAIATAANMPFDIGAWSDNQRFFNGTLDEFHVWNVARTAAQIQHDMNCTFVAAQTGLVASYNFNEGTPNDNNVGLTTLIDNSGNANNGTLTNFDLTGGSSSNWTNDANMTNPLPVISGISGVNILCAGSKTTLTVNGTAATYTWSTNASSAITTTVSVQPANTATFNVTGANGACLVTDSIVVTVNQLPTISVNSATICAGNTATLTASGTATSYTWNTGDNTVSIAPTPTTNTSYTVTGKDANCSNMAVATVTVDQLPSISVNNAIICTGNSAVLTVSGTVTSYSWNTGDNTVSIAPTPTTNTSYTVTGKNANCSNMAVATVTVNQLPTISVNNPAICIGNTATLTVSGTVTSYTWNTGSNAPSITPTPTAAATAYTVSGTDANNCINMAVATVTVNQLPTVTFTLNPNTYCSTDPSVTLSASPSGGAYTGTAVSGNQFNPGTAGAGTYTLTYVYTDGNTCSNTATAGVTVQVCSTGIDQLTNTSVNSYPNPTSSDLFIQTTTTLDNATVEVYDMIGQKVLVENLHNTTTRLNLSTLNNAMYQIRVLNNNTLIYQTKIIKQQ